MIEPNLENLQPRIRDQVEYIREQFRNGETAKNEYGPDGITIGVATSDDGVAYMYAEGQILVRENYVEKVQEILNMLPAPPVRKIGEPPAQDRAVEPLIDGVKVLHLKPRGDTPQPPVVDALEAVDAELGPGYATPNHVLTVAGDAGPCPATEPEVVDDGIEPYPSVCPGDAGAGISIYVADTGLIKYNDDHVTPDGKVVTNVGKPHAWLAGVRGDRDPRHPVAGDRIRPYVGHGTFVAGVARCLAPGATIYVANAFRIAGSTLESDLVQNLDAALARGYDLFHLSITGPTRQDIPLISFEGWLRRLHQYKGAACIVAAGNSGSRLPTWPAGFPGVVSVGALAADWRSRALFSNYGPWVDVYAPGRDLVNAFGIGTYRCYTHPYKPEERKFYGMAKWSGTSFSTPVVTGLIAARMSRTGENGQEAAVALLAEARSHAITGVGAVLLPCCDEDACASPGHSHHAG